MSDPTPVRPPRTTLPTPQQPLQQTPGSLGCHVNPTWLGCVLPPPAAAAVSRLTALLQRALHPPSPFISRFNSDGEGMSAK